MIPPASPDLTLFTSFASMTMCSAGGTGGIGWGNATNVLAALSPIKDLFDSSVVCTSNGVGIAQETLLHSVSNPPGVFYINDHQVIDLLAAAIDAVLLAIAAAVIVSLVRRYRGRPV